MSENISNSTVHKANRGFVYTQGEVHEAVAKQGQKREGVPIHYACSRSRPYKIAKWEDTRPPLPPPSKGPLPDDDSTDEDMPGLRTPTPPRSRASTALADRFNAPADALVFPTTHTGRSCPALAHQHFISYLPFVHGPYHSSWHGPDAWTVHGPVAFETTRIVQLPTFVSGSGVRTRVNFH